MFQKAVTLTAGFIAGKGVQMNDMQAVEYAFFNVGVGLFEFLQQSFGFHAFAEFITVSFVLHFGKAAGAAEK